MDKWIYFEKKSKKGPVTLLRCPHCVNTITWNTYDYALRNGRFCPFCGGSVEGYIYERDLKEEKNV